MGVWTNSWVWPTKDHGDLGETLVFQQQNEPDARLWAAWNQEDI